MVRKSSLRLYSKTQKHKIWKKSIYDKRILTLHTSVGLASVAYVAALCYFIMDSSSSIVVCVCLSNGIIAHVADRGAKNAERVIIFTHLV